MTILLLFPFHTFFIYNNYGENNYVKGPPNAPLTAIIVSFWPWFMPLLFAAAGISAKHALEQKTVKAFIIARVKKLLVPLFFGLLTITPCLTYFAERFHNGYTGSYLYQYALYFTKPTDLTGYTGGFTPGPLWFILYLFVISLLSIPVIRLASKIKAVEKLSALPALPLLFVLPFAAQVILDIAGKSVGEYFCYYMMGYAVLSGEKTVEKCVKYRFLFGILALAAAAVYMRFFSIWLAENKFPVVTDALGHFYAACAILFILGFFKKHVDFSNRAAAYFSKTSFGVYLFHLPWITAAAFYVFPAIQNVYAQAAVIMLAAMPCTFLTVEALRRFFVTRFMFALTR